MAATSALGVVESRTLMTGLVKVSGCRPLKRAASCVALPHKAIHPNGPEPAGIRLAQQDGHLRQPVKTSVQKYGLI